MSELSLPLPAPASLRPLRLCSDDQLARRAARGDRRAFEAIFERHHQAVYRYCRSILNDAEDAADALQNTMAAVLRSLEGETREIALKAWIFRIAHNEALNVVRRRRPQVQLDDAQACPQPSLESEVLASERLRQLVADVQGLPERQRGALVMRELNDLGYDEIAAVFGVSEGAARQTVHEARTALHAIEQGRSMACADIRELIGERDGRLLRGRKVRAHLRACSSCEGFRTAIGERSTALGIAAPPLGAPFAGSILHGLLGNGGGAGGAAAGAGASGAGAAAAVSAAPLANTAVATGIVAKAAVITGAGTKAVAALAAAATLTGGAVVAEKRISDDGRDTPSGQSSSPVRAQPVGASAGASAQKQFPSTASAVKAKDPKAVGTGKSKAATGSRAAEARAKRSAVATAAERAAKQARKVGAKAAKDPVTRAKKSRAKVATAKRTPAVSSANRGRPTDLRAPTSRTPKTEAPASSGAVQLPKVRKGQPPDMLPGG